jgi:outer membrane protein assembly factor BamB
MIVCDQVGCFVRWGSFIVLVALIWAIGGELANATTSSSHSPGSHSWTVYHNDPAGSGVAAPGSAVAAKTVAWTSPALDGQIYGEPLVWAGRIYVATENDTIYALSSATGGVAWSRHLGKAVLARSLPCGNITPTVGITGTPVIDPSRKEIFVVADEFVGRKPVHMLVGLNTASGKTEMTQDVDPQGADAAALLQRTGLTLDAGQVVFGFGGNYGDCPSYHGQVVAVPETGGAPRRFTVDAAPGESQGAIWMGGAAPVVDNSGHIWVSAGNGSVSSYKHAYDYSDSVLELSSSLRLLQFFAPRTWASNNSQDLDISTAPALLPDGQVMVADKSRTVYLLNGKHLGGIGGAQATLGSACSSDIDGGSAVVGMTVYLPCLSGIIAIRATRSPPSLHLLWNSGTGGGPPIVAAGLVWTIGQNGMLYGLDPATGKVREQIATGGVPANHFPTPSVGDGFLLATCAENAVAFAASAHGTGPAMTPLPGSVRRLTCQPYSAPGAGIPRRALAVLAVLAAGVFVAMVGLGWFLWRRRLSATG